METEKLLCSLGINALNPELNPMCHFLALLGAHHILHVSRIRVNLPLYILQHNGTHNFMIMGFRHGRTHFYVLAFPIINFDHDKWAPVTTAWPVLR